MEGEEKGRECRPKRCYQCSRLEDQLWETAYELVWPVVAKALRRRLEDAENGQNVSHRRMMKGA